MDPAPAEVASSQINLRRIAAYHGIRVLTWNGVALYGCRGYHILRLRPQQSPNWESVVQFRPTWWRNLTCRNQLTFRLVRDGFHALAILGDGSLVGAVPGAIVTRSQGSSEFRITHPIVRGTRPLHITATPSGRVFWGEYFDNRERAEVHVYVSEDSGATWQVAYTFPPGAIRHVHNIVDDRWRKCLWILTGDERKECKVLCASYDLHSIEVVLEGNQQARAVSAIPTEDGLYLSTDTPYEKNHIYRLDGNGNLERVGDLNSSSIYGCRVGENLFFTTMAEPSPVNDESEVQIVGSTNGRVWPVFEKWKKDFWPMYYFQYGNIILPDGNNNTKLLAATTIAVAGEDLTTSLWEVI